MTITDRNSYVDFRLQENPITLNDLERQFTTLSSSFMRIATKRLMLELRNFHDKVPLRSALSYPHIKFDDKI